MSFIARIALTSSFLLAAAGNAQTPPSVLTEAEAVRMALTAAPVESLNAAELALARADAQRERLWPNPFLDISRESAAEDEDFVTITQSLDLSGRRSLRRRAAALRVDAVRGDVAESRLALARLVRSEFNAVVTQQELVDGLARWTERINEAAATAARLQAGGEVSGYDRRRLERERVGAEARLMAERGALAAAKLRLASRIGADSLDGVTLERTAPRLSAVDIRARVAQRPDVIALDRRIEAAELDARAARRWKVPSVDLTAGAKRSDTADGAIFGVGLPLPLFNRNQDELAKADALVAKLTAQRTLLITRATGEALGLAREADELRRAAQHFRDGAVPTSERLTATAEAAYRAGEVGILELLDAYRTALDAQIEAATLERRAREIEIDLAHAIGEVNR